MDHTDSERSGLYQQETKLVAEGVRICRRADHKSGRWQAHITVAGRKVPYRKSTKTCDETLAAQRALKFQQEVAVKIEHDIPLTDWRVKHVAESFKEYLQKEQRNGHKKEGRVTFLVGTLERYVIPYFGKRMIGSITEREIDVYREWRKDNGRGTKGGTRTNPKLNTLRFEESALRQMLEYAVTLGALDRARVPKIKSPKKASDTRPGLTKSEWRKLRDAMDASVADATHPHVKRKRELLRGYVRFMVATGLRVGDARKLRWCDIEDHTTQEGRETVQLTVTGKTRKRPCIAQPVAKIILAEVKALTKPVDQDSYVFTLTGKPVATFGVGFRSLLEKTNLLTDLEGTKRTIPCIKIPTERSFRRAPVGHHFTCGFDQIINCTPQAQSIISVDRHAISCSRWQHASHAALSCLATPYIRPACQLPRSPAMPPPSRDRPVRCAFALKSDHAFP